MRKLWKAVFAILLLVSFCIHGALAAPLTAIRITQTVQKGNLLYVFFDALDVQKSPVTDISSDKTAITIGAVTEAAEIKPLSASDEGTCYVFLVDTSSRLYNGNIRQIRESLAEWFDRMPDTDYATIITFGASITPTTSEFSNDKTMLAQLAKSIAFKGYQSQLYNALETAYSFAGRQSDALPKKRAIIAMSDGVDIYRDGPTKTAEDLIPIVEAADIPLYVVGCETESKKTQLDQLARVADVSGGMLVTSKASQVADTYNAYFDRIQSSYVAAVTLSDETVVGQEQALMLTVEHSGAVTKAQSTVLLAPFPLANPAPAITSQPSAGASLSQDQQPKPGFFQQYGLILVIGLMATALAVVVIVLLQRRKPNRTEPPVKVYSPLPHMQHFDDEGTAGFELDGTRDIASALSQNDLEKTMALDDALQHKGLLLSLSNSDVAVPRTYEAVLTGRIYVGRNTKVNDIVIDDPTVSAKHCVFSLEADGVYLQDLNSSNGTYLTCKAEELPVDTVTGSLIQSGCKIRLGNSKLDVSISERS